MYAIDMVIYNQSGVDCRVKVLDEYDIIQEEEFTILQDGSHELTLDSGEYKLRVSSSETATYSVPHVLNEDNKQVYIRPVGADNEVVQDNETAE